MLKLDLKLKPQTEDKLKKILDLYEDKELFAQSIIDYQIAELRKAILNIRIDLQNYEKKYNMPTTEFYGKFKKGMIDDDENYLIWAGIYEMLRENERRLEGLS